MCCKLLLAGQSRDLRMAAHIYVDDENFALRLGVVTSLQCVNFTAAFFMFSIV